MADRKDFVTTFEYFTKEPFPLELPPNYEVFQTIQREVELDVLVGTEIAKGNLILIQGDTWKISEVADGYFFSGFWGHGMSSHAFYWVEVTGENRVFFRLSFGGAYSDPDRDKQRIRNALANLVNIKNLWGNLVISSTMICSMGMLDFSFGLNDGTEVHLSGSSTFSSNVIDWESSFREKKFIEQPAPQILLDHILSNYIDR